MESMNKASQDRVEIGLGLGSNLGDRLASLRAAKEALAPYVEIVKVSPVYETSLAFQSDQPLFLNAALRGVTTLEPKALLYTLKDIEIDIGRRPTFRFGPRIIDLDILFYGNEQVRLPDLTIPHPLMLERVFVLKPLADVASEWIHPGEGKSVADLLAALPDIETAKIVAENF